MVELGVVADIRDEKLIINIKRHSACGGCRACGMREGRLMELELENTIGARKGDKVEIELDDLTILRGAFLFYGAPLLGLMLGIFIGKAVAARMAITMPQELVSAFFGIIAIFVTLLFIKRYNFYNREKYKPKISRIQDKGGCDEKILGRSNL